MAQHQAYTEFRTAKTGYGAPLAPADSLLLPRALPAVELLCAVLRAGRHALFDGWRVVGETALFQAPESRSRATIRLDAAAGQDLRQELEETDALTLDVLLVLLDRLQRTPTGAVVNARVVLDAKGYRRCGRERLAFERKILQHLRRLERLKLEKPDGPQAFFTFAPRNVARTDFIVRPGPALAGGSEAPLEIATRVLQLDHRRNRGADALAKKLAVLFAICEAVPLTSLSDLLARVGEPVGRASDARQGRVIARLESAIRRLTAFELLDLRQSANPSRRRAWEQALRVTAPAFAPPAAGHVEPRGDEPAPAPRREDPRPSEPAARRRGRPRFSPSEGQRRLVIMLSARGRTREQIAHELGISLPTLRRYFGAELASTKTTAWTRAHRGLLTTAVEGALIPREQRSWA